MCMRVHPRPFLHPVLGLVLTTHECHGCTVEARPPRKYREPISRSVGWNQFILNVMQLQHTRTHGRLLKVQRYCIEDILAEFFPGLAFREDGMAKSTGAIAAFLRVADLENQ